MGIIIILIFDLLISSNLYKNYKLKSKVECISERVYTKSGCLSISTQRSLPSKDRCERPEDSSTDPNHSQTEALAALTR